MNSIKESAPLSTIYPITKRWIMKQTLLLLSAACLINFVLYSVKIEFFSFHPEAWLTFYSSLLIWTVILIFRIIFLVTIRKNFSYEIVDDELKITRGFLFKEEIEYPLKNITAIQLKRSFADFLFHTASLVIIVPGNIPIALSRIPGLSVKSAADLRRYLLDRN
jgi:membrane protein YdbS with pleckstrin-like domain